MKKIFIILMFLAFLLQFSFLSMFDWNIQIPNLILIVATIIGIRKSLMENLGWFLLAGGIFEVFSADFFGFYLILFALVGLSVWFFRNVILNKEYSFITEILFWFLVKVIFDSFFKIELFLLNLLQRNPFDNFSLLPDNYFKEVMIFVLCGTLATALYKKFFSGK